jgi:hypothetical protein
MTRQEYYKQYYETHKEEKHQVYVEKRKDKMREEYLQKRGEVIYCECCKKNVRKIGYKLHCTRKKHLKNSAH